MPIVDIHKDMKKGLLLIVVANFYLNTKYDQ
jgi:hypothetical protein